MDLNQFTPTEQKILLMLADGQDHSRLELQRALPRQESCLTEESSVRQHISKIRKKLRPVGEDIVCIRSRWGSTYRLARLLASATDGRR